MNEFNTYSKSYSTARYTRLIYLDSLLVGSLYSPYLYYLVGLVILALLSINRRVVTCFFTVYLSIQNLSA